MSYRIHYDGAENILHLTLDGFWTPLTLAGFAAEMLARATMLRLRGKRFAVLSDSRQFAIQSATVMAGFDRILKRGMEFNPGPMAIVVATALNKLQAERAFASPNIRVFRTMEEARAWIDAERAVATR